jgi:putative restriction endonuclease
MAAFDWLAAQVRLHGDVLPRMLLAEGFRLNDVRVPLLGPQGIFKPAVLTDAPLSIVTTTKSPYSDAVGSDGLLRYSYRGTDPQHSDNRGLRVAMERRLPLVYFHSVVPGLYLAVWPVFVVGDNVASLSFSVAVDDLQHAERALRREYQRVDESGDEGRRAYITATVLVRVHQRSFRERVLRAYQEQCAFCRLKHRELLDAAHIIGDKEELGEPHVSNGLSLCKLHHAAYDAMFIAVRPDYRIIVRPDVLTEKDGPMLLHGLQGLHEQRIALPHTRSQRPDIRLLEQQFAAFEARTHAA